MRCIVALLYRDLGSSKAVLGVNLGALLLPGILERRKFELERLPQRQQKVQKDLKLCTEMIQK